MGWLHSIPKSANKKSKAKPRSRLTELKDNKLALALPEADQFLVNSFHSLGYKMSGDMGGSPILWSEVKAFSDTRDLPLSSWECDQLIMMSREYCSYIAKGKDRSCESPWNHPSINDIEYKRVNVSKQLKSLFQKAKDKGR